MTHRADTHEHPDVGYEISDVSGKHYGAFAEAAADALQHAIANGSATLDVVIWSEEGARWFGGDDAVEQYREDPEASVFERLEISANSLGRIA